MPKNWYEKLIPAKVGAKSKSAIPEGVWVQCKECKVTLYQEEFIKNLKVCTKCGYHDRLGARERLDLFLDSDTQRIELGSELEPKDILEFKDSKKYKDRLTALKNSLNENDALVAMTGALKGLPVVASAFEFRFIGGSMGAVVGERFVLGAEHALENHKPFINFSASGGARMQEGLVSLMQMAKTSAVLAKLKEAGIPFISVLTDPTTGGVSASLGMLGDVNIAEPNALIGFAGPRVIQQTVRETLPDKFQTAEFLLEHGAIDLVMPRHQLRDRIHNLLSVMTKQQA